MFAFATLDGVSVQIFMVEPYTLPLDKMFRCAQIFFSKVEKSRKTMPFDLPASKIMRLSSSDINRLFKYNSRMGMSITVDVLSE